MIKLIELQSAVGWDYQEKLVKHESQTDGTKGFGGKFGVQTDRIDKVIPCLSKQDLISLIVICLELNYFFFFKECCWLGSPRKIRET